MVLNQNVLEHEIFQFIQIITIAIIGIVGTVLIIGKLKDKPTDSKQSMTGVMHAFEQREKIFEQTVADLMQKNKSLQGYVNRMKGEYEEVAESGDEEAPITLEMIMPFAPQLAEKLGVNLDVEALAKNPLAVNYAKSWLAKKSNQKKIKEWIPMLVGGNSLENITDTDTEQQPQTIFTA